MRILYLVLLALLLNTACAETVRVAVAANFAAPMCAIASTFEQQTNHSVELSLGSSGKFFAQIKNGAPFHVFLSADQARPEALENEALIATGSRFTYASGRLALWSRKSDFIDSELTVLKTGTFNKLALANPRLAPYGRAAVEVLEQLKLEKTTRPQWVTGENIAQTYQFVYSGNADIGFLALSQVIDSQFGSIWPIPETLHQPIKQDAVLLKNGQGNAAALALMAFLRSQEAARIIQRYGYQIPTNTSGAPSQ